jgi:hypothetical protein
MLRKLVGMHGAHEYVHMTWHASMLLLRASLIIKTKHLAIRPCLVGLIWDGLNLHSIRFCTVAFCLYL